MGKKIIDFHGGGQINEPSFFVLVSPSNYLVIVLEGMLKQQRYIDTVWCGVFGADMTPLRTTIVCLWKIPLISLSRKLEARAPFGPPCPTPLMNWGKAILKGFLFTMVLGYGGYRK